MRDTDKDGFLSKAEILGPDAMSVAISLKIREILTRSDQYLARSAATRPRSRCPSFAQRGLQMTPEEREALRS